MNEKLKLENQLCFPLYVCAKEVVRRYTPLLEPFGLTYTQYIAMMVLWEQKSVTVKELGKKLYLDSGTLTPMLKKMEKAGWLVRERSKSDERVVVVTVTSLGEQLQEKIADIPLRMSQCIKLDSDDAMRLYSLLKDLLKKM